MTDSLLNAARESFLFRGLSDEYVSALETRSGVNTLTFSSGENITAAGKKIDGIYLILTGTAYVYNKPSDAGRVLISEQTVGGIIGAVSVYDTDKAAATTVTAKTAVSAMHISEDAFKEMIAENTTLCETFIGYLTKRVRFLVGKLEVLGAPGASAKLYLHIVNNATGNTYHMSHGVTALSAALGIGRVTLYRAIDDLTAHGLIVREGKDLILSGN